MPLAVCRTCGLATEVTDHGPAVCPECQDWLTPPAKAPKAAGKRTPFPLGLAATFGVIALAVIGFGVLGLLGPHLWPKPETGPPPVAAPPRPGLAGPAGLPYVPEKRFAIAFGRWTAKERPRWVNEWADGVPADSGAGLNDTIEPAFQKGIFTSIAAAPNILVMPRRAWEASPDGAFELAKAVAGLLYLKGFGEQLEIRADEDDSLMATYSLRTGLRVIGRAP